jgi:hypothetical protein
MNFRDSTPERLTVRDSRSEHGPWRPFYRQLCWPRLDLHIILSDGPSDQTLTRDFERNRLISSTNLRSRGAMLQAKA